MGVELQRIVKHLQIKRIEHTETDEEEKCSHLPSERNVVYQVCGNAEECSENPHLNNIGYVPFDLNPRVFPIVVCILDLNPSSNDIAEESF